jgi:ribosome-associated protein
LRPPVPTPEALKALVERSLDDDQAQDVVVIDLAGKSSMADFMVVASGRSTRHVGAMADHLRERMKAEGVSGVEIEGQTYCDWVLVDGGDVIIHVFRPEVRAFYNLEKMWGVESPPSHPETVGIEDDDPVISAESGLTETDLSETDLY